MSTTRRNMILAALATPLAWFTSRVKGEAPEKTMSGPRFAQYLANEVLEFDRLMRQRESQDAISMTYVEPITVPFMTKPLPIYVRGHDYVNLLPDPDIGQWVDELRDPETPATDVTLGMGCVLRRCFLDRMHVLLPRFYAVGTFCFEMTKFEETKNVHWRPRRLITPRYTVDRSELTPRRLAHLVICMYRDMCKELRRLRDSSPGSVGHVAWPDAEVTRSGPIVEVYGYTDYRIVEGTERRPRS